MDLTLEEALAKDIAAFAGTKGELSVRVCGSKQGLAHKQAHFRGSYFSAEEVVNIQMNSGSRHSMHAQAQLLGGVFLDLPSCELPFPEDRESLMKRMRQIHIEMGQLFDCVDEATEDGRIDAREMVLIDAYEQKLITAVAGYKQLLYLSHPDVEAENDSETKE